MGTNQDRNYVGVPKPIPDPSLITIFGRLPPVRGRSVEQVNFEVGCLSGWTSG